MMRVLFVAGRFPPEVQTGFSRAFSRLVDQARRHAEVRLVVGLHGRGGRVPPDALSVRVGERRAGHWLPLWRATRSLVAEVRPHVVVVSGLGMPPVGAPIVAVPPDRSERGWRPRGRGNRLGRATVRTPRAVVVPTLPMRDQVAARGVPLKRIRHVPVGWERPARLPPALAEDGPLELLHPGTIHPARGQHVSVDAVSRLPPRLRRRVRLTVRGRVEDERYLAQLRVAAAGHPVAIVPQRGAPRMEACHAVLLPVAVQAGFPEAALAALSWGRPVVWSDVGAMAEVLDGHGVRLPAADVVGVRDAIVGLLEHEISTAERTRAWEQAGAWSWERLWPEWEAVLRSAQSR